jgi:transcriptional regulator with XRE-family HTH domain
MQLGERLQQLREERGVSLSALSQLTGLFEGYLARVETSELPAPTPNTIALLAQTLGLDDSTSKALQLLGGTGSRLERYAHAPYSAPNHDKPVITRLRGT